MPHITTWNGFRVVSKTAADLNRLDVGPVNKTADQGWWTVDGASFRDPVQDLAGQGDSASIVHPQFRTGLISSDQMRPIDSLSETFGDGDPRILGPISGNGVFKPQGIDAKGSVIFGDNHFKPGADGDSITAEGHSMNIWGNGGASTFEGRMPRVDSNDVVTCNGIALDTQPPSAMHQGAMNSVRGKDGAGTFLDAAGNKTAKVDWTAGSDSSYLNETANVWPQQGECTSIVHPQFQEVSKAIVHPQFRTGLINRPEPEFISGDDGDALRGIVHQEDDAIVGTTGMDKQFTTGGGSDSITGQGRPMTIWGNGGASTFGDAQPTADGIISSLPGDMFGDSREDVFSGLNQGFIAAPVNELRSENRFVFEPMAAMTSFGGSSEHVLGQQSNWDVICDIGTSVRQAAVMPSFAMVYNNNG